MNESGSPTVDTPVGRRASRRDEILRATRALFDATGSREAQIEDIARAVGINRAIIYRHFIGKEELFAEVVVTYLGELSENLAAADDRSRPAAERLGLLTDALFDYAIGQPAFVDCAMTLVRRPGEELMAEVGQAVMIRLGQAMWGSLSHAVEVLKTGNTTGEFEVADPILLSNLFYTQALGALSLAMLQMSVHEGGDGVPATENVPIEEIKRYARIAAVAQARGI